MMRKAVIGLIGSLVSGLAIATDHLFVSTDPSPACQLLTSKHFSDFTILDDELLVDLRSLKIVKKNDWSYSASFRIYESSNPASKRTITLIESEDNDWIATIPDPLISCRMALKSITESMAINLRQQSTGMASKDQNFGEKKPENQMIVGDGLNTSMTQTNISNSDLELKKEIERLRAELQRANTTLGDQGGLIELENRPPTLGISEVLSSDGHGTIRGWALDKGGLAEVRVQNQAVALDKDGKFSTTIYVPEGGVTVEIIAIDSGGLNSKTQVFVDRDVLQAPKIQFESLDPTKAAVEPNEDSVALIIGVAEYEHVAAADFSDADAKVFSDYAKLKLGVRRDRTLVLSNRQADMTGVLLAVKDWLNRSIRAGKSDVYIFFAGHGLASENGEQTYFIPYDGSPRLLSRTAISREELFSDVARSAPRSVTVFLDTCYSGDARGGDDRLIAARPLGIKVREQIIPDGFTIFAAAAGDQTAKPLKEAQHGMFSYFLMKGMEGGADSDGNNEITARELHAYVRENVVQQSGGSQVPELQGDGEKVLVRFR